MLEAKEFKKKVVCIKRAVKSLEARASVLRAKANIETSPLKSESFVRQAAELEARAVQVREKLPEASKLVREWFQIGHDDLVVRIRDLNLDEIEK